MDFLQNLLIYIVPIVIVLGVVVTVHELGHFLAAKAFGTKIDRFSIGFGSPIAHWRDKHGVDWRIGWMPLGGYVRFAGDENMASIPDSADLAQMRREVVATEGAGAVSAYFHFKPLYQRAIIVAAGPVANFLLAIAIFAGVLFFLGEPIQPPKIGGVQKGSAAAAAGLLPGDVVTKIGGQAVDSWDDIKPIVMLSSGTPLEFVVDRGGQSLTLTATPVRGEVRDGLGRTHRLGVLGIIGANERVWVKRYGPLEAIAKGTASTYQVIQTTVTYVGRMIGGRENADQLSGPLGMAQMSGDIAKQTARNAPDMQTLVAASLFTLLMLIANISVGIGFMNLLPVPVLDGGHLVFYAYEAVARRPLAAKVQAVGYRVGLALVLSLMLFATWNDLQRLNVFKSIGSLFS